MPCTQCNGVIDLVEQSGGTKEGQFREEYECLECGATGAVTGEASDHPEGWNYYGSVFNE